MVRSPAGVPSSRWSCHHSRVHAVLILLAHRLKVVIAAFIRAYDFFRLVRLLKLVACAGVNRGERALGRRGLRLDVLRQLGLEENLRLQSCIALLRSVLPRAALRNLARSEVLLALRLLLAMLRATLSFHAVLSGSR